MNIEMKKKNIVKIMIKKTILLLKEKNLEMTARQAEILKTQIQ